MYYYKPFQNVSIDESFAHLVWNQIHQYFPNKHHIWFGTKVWMLACSKISYLRIDAQHFWGCLIWDTHWTNQVDLFGQGYDVIGQLMEMAVHTIVDIIYLLKSVNSWYPQLYISAMLPRQPLTMQ